MTVDRTRLRIYALGNHRAGYQGAVIIEDGSVFEHLCGHEHAKTDEARNCIRRLIRTKLDGR